MADIYITIDNPRSSDNLRLSSSSIINDINFNLPSSSAMWPLIDLFNLAILVPNFIRAFIRKGE